MKLTKEQQRDKIRNQVSGSVSMPKTPRIKYVGGGKKKSKRGSFLKHVKSLYG